jgi:hypothetical protein
MFQMEFPDRLAETSPQRLPRNLQAVNSRRDSAVSKRAARIDEHSS